MAKEEEEQVYSTFEPAKETAKKIRKKLRQEFPDFPATHFKVKTSVYAGGSSIHVRWEDLPSNEEVNNIVQQYKSASFDGMIDMETRHGYVDPDDGLTYSGAGYIFAQQELSDERTEVIEEYIHEKYNAEYLEDYYSANKARKEANARLGVDNKLVERYDAEKFGNRDYKADIKKYINDYLDKIPSYTIISVPASALDMLGDYDAENKRVKLGKKLNFRNYAFTEIESEITVKVLEKVANEVSTLDEYESEIAYLLNRAFSKKLNLEIAETIYRHLKNYYTVEVTNVVKELRADFNQNKALEEDYLVFMEYQKIIEDRDFYLYENLNLQNPEKPAEEYIKQYVNRQTQQFWVIQQQKRIEEAKSTEKTPDEKAVNIIYDFYTNLPKEVEVRLGRILNKNEKEVMLASSKNKNLMRKLNADKLLIARYESPVDNGKVFYQTPFGLWVAYDMIDGLKVVPIYRLGIDSIADSVKVAKNVVTKYQLNTSVLWFANKMYLRN